MSDTARSMPKPASTSAAEVSGAAPSLSSPFVPAESADVISPGTANTSRPSSSARSAVISAPLRSRASTTTVAGAEPGDDAVARREAPRRRLDAGCVLGHDQTAAPRCAARARRGPRGSRGRRRSRARRRSTPPASSAPRCASPSTPRARPLTTTSPGAGELAREAARDRAPYPEHARAPTIATAGRASSSSGAAPRTKRPAGGSWIERAGAAAAAR